MGEWLVNLINAFVEAKWWHVVSLAVGTLGVIIVLAYGENLELSRAEVNKLLSAGVFVCACALTFLLLGPIF